MGLMEQLGYAPREPNVAQRGVQRLGSTHAGAWFFQKALYPMDRWMYRASHGKATVASVMSGLPVIMLTTTGARSGRPRSMPLIGFPVGEFLAVIGTNFGQKPTPGWVYNLRADPSARIGYRDRTIDVTSRRATQEETEEAFRVAATVYAGYGEYRSRVDSREINVFMLDAAG